MKALEIEGGCVRLGGRAVLDGISLTFSPGVFTVIVGANGAGKSTLMSLMAGLRAPDEGAVLLDRQPLVALSSGARARRLGLLPQKQEIAWALDVETLAGLGRTARMGAMGLRAEDRRAVGRALDATGMTAFARREVSTLSGGERGRALIARVLAGEPEWLLADEPLTGLDPGHQLEILKLLKAFCATPGQGVVTTLHDLALAARVADRVIVLHEGRVLADGPAREALSPEVVRTAYGVEIVWLEGRAGPLIELVGPAADEKGAPCPP